MQTLAQAHPPNGNEKTSVGKDNLSGTCFDLTLFVEGPATLPRKSEQHQ